MALSRLRGVTFERLFYFLNEFDTSLEFDEWLKDAELIPRNFECDCGSDMRIAKNRQTFKWTCRKKKECGKSYSYLYKTFFFNSHLDKKEIFKLSYFWSRNYLNYGEVRFQLGRDESSLSDNTICDWFNFFRDICSEYYLKNPQILGGPDKIVEIDETCISRRKYNRGRMITEQVWIFGGVERGNSKKVFMEIVDNRTAATLLPIIQRRIAPGTSIMSDLWRSYFNVGRLPEGYEHLTVNHSMNFVNPDNGAHTQSVESNWQKFKHGHKHRYGTHRSMLQSYIVEYCWRKEFGGSDCLFNLWSQICEHYKELQRTHE